MRDYEWKGDGERLQLICNDEDVYGISPIVVATIDPTSTGLRWGTIDGFRGDARSIEEAKRMAEAGLGLDEATKHSLRRRNARPSMADDCIFQISTGRTGSMDDMEKLSEPVEPQPFRREVRKIVWQVKNKIRLNVLNPIRRFFRLLGRFIARGRMDS